MQETRASLPEFVLKMKDSAIEVYRKRSEIPTPMVHRQAKKWELLHKVRVLLF